MILAALGLISIGIFIGLCLGALFRANNTKPTPPTNTTRGYEWDSPLGPPYYWLHFPDHKTMPERAEKYMSRPVRRGAFDPQFV